MEQDAALPRGRRPSQLQVPPEPAGPPPQGPPGALACAWFLDVFWDTRAERFDDVRTLFLLRSRCGGQQEEQVLPIEVHVPGMAVDVDPFEDPAAFMLARFMHLNLGP